MYNNVCFANCSLIKSKIDNALSNNRRLQPVSQIILFFLVSGFINIKHCFKMDLICEYIIWHLNVCQFPLLLVTKRKRKYIQRCWWSKLFKCEKVRKKLDLSASCNHLRPKIHTNTFSSHAIGEQIASVAVLRFDGNSSRPIAMSVWLHWSFSNWPSPNVLSHWHV